MDAKLEGVFVFYLNVTEDAACAVGPRRNIEPSKERYVMAQEVSCSSQQAAMERR